MIDSIIQARQPVIDSLAWVAVESANKTNPEFAMTLLDKVDSMYSQVITYTVGLIAIVGIVTPAVINWLMTRSLGKERKSLTDELAANVNAMEEKFNSYDDVLKQTKEDSEKEWVDHKMQLDAVLDFQYRATNLIVKRLSHETDVDEMNSSLALALLAFLDIVEKVESPEDVHERLWRIALSYSFAAVDGLQACVDNGTSEKLEVLKKRRTQIKKILKKEIMPKAYRTKLESLHEVLEGKISQLENKLGI